MAEQQMLAWYYLSGNRIEAEGLHDKGKTGPARWITDQTPGVSISATIYDRAGAEVVALTAFEYVADSEGNWAAEFPEGVAPLVYGEEYVAKVRVAGAGAMTRTWWLPIVVVKSGPGDA